jgi:anaerobic ribonucleoside-triphosphate reductase activating protein
MSTLRVGGLVPLTTLDYPGKLACVLFCQGCAWRCRYCHNPYLIPVRDAGRHPWPEVLDFLRRRRGLLEAVVFSGGEPTLQRALPEAMASARALGLAVGLHSAGIRPAACARALPGADWVGFDIKALPEDAPAVTGVAGSGEANWRSLDHLLASGVAHEVRVTVHWHLFRPERLWQLAEALRGKGVQRVAVQIVRTTQMLDATLPLAFPPADRDALWTELRRMFPGFVLRDA